MCSTPVQRIADIGQAIDDLAADARTAYRPAARKQRQPAMPGDSSPGKPARAGAAGETGAGEADAASDADEVLIRLAALWGKLAELDPEVAKRLPTYGA
jgi:hypothetical protein